MTTLEAIGFTLTGGLGVGLLSFVVFGFALHSRSVNIAPRCTARHPDTIYNKNSHPIKSNNIKEKEDRTEYCKEEAQYRGNPMYGWIAWTLSLSYETLLRGVPGTGTRKGGMEGSLLKVNLDGIIFIKFHALCLKVALLASVLVVGVVLPLNYTARCTMRTSIKECFSSQDYSLTNFEKTTLKNIPQLKPDDNLSVATIIGSSISIWGSPISALLSRLYAVVIVSWAIVFYALRLVEREWVDNLALRRVYYLEADHWGIREAELEETELRKFMSLSSSEDDEVIDEQYDKSSLEQRRRVNRQTRLQNTSKNMTANYSMNSRDPWIPHPEQRETVPNIELYSVLVGSLPSSLSELFDDASEEMNRNISKRQFIKWQLALTASFFDHCVPNQAGFSSSVAAVTVLPNAPDLAAAWRKWYAHAALLRKLRFIRSRLAEMRHFEIADFVDESFSDSQDRNVSSPKYGNNILTPNGIDEYAGNANFTARKSELKKFQDNLNYFKNVFGSRFDGGRFDGDVEHVLYQAMSFGPEQNAVYSREFAQGAAGCCPHGCGEGRIRGLNIDKLVAMERLIENEAQSSFQRLLSLQNNYVSAPVSTKESDAGHADSQTTGSSNDLKAKKKFQLETRLFSELSVNLHSSDLFLPDLENANSRPMASPIELKLPAHSSRSYRCIPQKQEMNNEMSAVDTYNQLLNMLDKKDWNQNLSHPSLTASAELDCLGDDGVKPGNIYLRSERKELLLESQSPSSDDNTFPRHRINTDWSHLSLQSRHSSRNRGESQWNQVERIVLNDETIRGVAKTARRRLSSGAWKIRMPSFHILLQSLSASFESLCRWATSKSRRVVGEITGDATFAVVTFTSRQAAVTARHCLADGRGYNRFRLISDVPVPPLADAAACDFVTCRGCCKPVTLTIGPKQQLLRKYISMVIVVGMYIFYTVPITAAASLVAPEKLFKIWPGLESVVQTNVFLNKLLSGFIPALLFTIFFALCPVIFRAIANFGSNAVSVNRAELFALKCYWWFMLITAFSGTSIGTMALNAINQRRLANNSFSDVLLEIAGTLPTQVSATWLNWIIFRTTVTLPLQYMLQLSTFIFQCFGWKFCRRCVMGGGPGGPVPYRIYIDSGVVFLCTVALSPLCPLVGPAACLYFLFCIPLWRRNCIFVYRPKFDTGGERWIFLADVCTTSVVVALVLLTTVMALKKAVGPAILAAIPIVPTLLHRKGVRKRFLKAYQDAALFQCSLLDGWDNALPTSPQNREAFRRFLVDAHKAAYVPICMAGGDTSCITTEPASVIPCENDAL